MFRLHRRHIVRAAPQCRSTFSTQLSHHQQDKNIASPKFEASFEQSHPARNGDIPFDTVHVIDAHTHRPGPPVTLKSIIEKLYSKKGGYYQLITSEPKPLVKFFPKLEKQKPKKHKAPEFKPLDLSWHIEAGDLAHKLKRMQDILRKGDHVDVFIRPKRNVSPPALDERNALKDSVVSGLQGRYKDVQIDNSKGVVLRMSFISSSAKS